MQINGLPESFDGFKRLTEEEQRYAHYTVLRALARCIDDHTARLEALESRKLWHAAAAAGGGVIGGFVAVLSAVKLNLWG